KNNDHKVCIAPRPVEMSYFPNEKGPETPLDMGTLILIATAPEFQSVFLVINFYIKNAHVDDLIAICHSAGGRPEGHSGEHLAKTWKSHNNQDMKRHASIRDA